MGLMPISVRSKFGILQVDCLIHHLVIIFPLLVVILENNQWTINILLVICYILYIIYLNKLLICMCIYMLVSLCTKLYMITCVNVEDRGSAEGYDDAFKEAAGDDAF